MKFPIKNDRQRPSFIIFVFQILVAFHTRSASSGLLRITVIAEKALLANVCTPEDALAVEIFQYVKPSSVILLRYFIC